MDENAYEKFSAINEGDIYQFTKMVNKKEINIFASLTGDFNPSHFEFKEMGENKKNGNLVHGLLISSLFSRIVGMYCPGKYGVYISQTLNFRNPVYSKDDLIVRCEVIGKSESTGIVKLKTEILSNNRIMVDGEAKVKFFI